MTALCGTIAIVFVSFTFGMLVGYFGCKSDMKQARKNQRRH